MNKKTMKKLANVIAVFPFVFVFLIYSCGNKTTKTKTLTTNIDSVKTVLVQLEDSTHKTWLTMIEEDDQKITYLKRLIDEVSYTKVYDKAIYDSLAADIENLKAIRYNQSSMSDSKKIDDYDKATAAIVNKVVVFAQGHPNFEDYPLMEELINDILETDNRVIYRRVDYDNAAMEYNNFIDNYKDLIGEFGNTARAKPLFQLSE